MKTKETQKREGIIAGFKLLWKFLDAKKRIQFIFCFVFSLFTGLIHVYISLIPALVVAKLTGQSMKLLGFIDLTQLDTIPFFIVVFGIVVLMWIFGMLHYRMIDVFARKCMCFVNQKVQDTLLLERKNMDLGMTIGEANYIAKSSVDNIYEIIEPFCWNFFKAIVTAIVIVIQVFTVSWIVGLLEIASVIIVCLCVYIRTKIQIPVVSKIERSNAKIGNHFLMSITNMPMITMIRSKNREKEELSKLNNEYLKHHIKRANICFYYWVGILSIEYIILAIMCIAFFLTSKSPNLASETTMIISMTLSIYSKSEDWGWQISNIQSASIKLCNLKRLYPSESQLLSNTNLPIEKIKNNPITTLTVKDYKVKLGSFEKLYNQKFESGNIYVINGQSGQGKTTLINAICGLREIESGHLVVNKRQKVSSLYDYREKISYLFQDSILFDRSLQENLSYPELELNEKSKELVNFFDMEKLLNRPNQNSTLSKTLSGGEKKRVDIIRTLSKESDIYLLDEPTNDLDPTNVEKVLLQMQKLANNGKIVITISHDERVSQITKNIINI